MAYPAGFQKDKEGYYIYKASGVTKDYAIDFASWLSGDTLASAVWSVPAGLNKLAESFDANFARIKLSGGVENTAYELSCSITTALSLSDTVKFRIVIEND